MVNPSLPPLRPPPNTKLSPHDPNTSSTLLNTSHKHIKFNSTSNDDSNRQKNNMSAEQIQQQYSQISTQIGQLRQKINELEGEKYEHDLVIKTLEPMADDRRCFRLIGGVLVERPKPEVETAVKTNLEQVVLLIERFQAELIDLEKAAIEFRKQHDIARGAGEDAEPTEESKKPNGVLA